MDNIDCFLSARSEKPRSLSPRQEIELLGSFLKNKELTKRMKTTLSHGLGITQNQVKHFFQMQSKKPRTVSTEAYSKLLQGKGLKDMYMCIYMNIIILNQCMHTFNLL